MSRDSKRDNHRDTSLDLNRQPVDVKRRKLLTGLGLTAGAVAGSQLPLPQPVSMTWAALTDVR